MEVVVDEGSPLAAYLEGEGEQDPYRPHEHDDPTLSATSSPSFAPRGAPKFRPRFRRMIPSRLSLEIPGHPAIASIHEKCSKTLNSTLGLAEDERFLEQFKYMIVASQLLNTQSFGQVSYLHSRVADVSSVAFTQIGPFSPRGAAATAIYAFLLVWLIDWVRGKEKVSKGRRVFVLGVIAIPAVLLFGYIRRQCVLHLRQQILRDTSNLLLKSRDFDALASGAFTLVQEVELVSRGYRISTPFPPITRIEDRGQVRRCARLRKTLRLCFADAIPRYKHACENLKPLVEQMDLERYYDIYDLNASDFVEANLGYSDAEFDDPDSLRVLKILASRFYIIRKIFLCFLLALDAHGGNSEFVTWSAAGAEIRDVGLVTVEVENYLRRILDEEQSFPVPPTPKLPASPSRERWRSQLRKLNSLSSGIRGLQAKLHVLQEETGGSLNETEEVTELGTHLLIQFDSIGEDLMALMREWDDAKAALASSIDRNEKRLSSVSVLLSPTTSLSGRTAVDEVCNVDAAREPVYDVSRSSYDFSSSDAEEVFEATVLPRQRVWLTREERMEKMKDDRSRRASMRDKTETNTRMLRELQTVISLRSKGRTNPTGRVTTL